MTLGGSKITATDGHAADSFGHYGIAMSGTDMLVAAPGDDEAGPNAGAAYVLTPDPDGGYQETKVFASDARAGDRFGNGGVSMGDAGFLIGSPYDDQAGTDAGAAYLYRPDGDGGHDEIKFMASDARPGDVFGAGVAMSGPNLLIAAAGNDEAGTDAGAVYLYRPNADGSYEETKILASDARPGDLFGHMGVAMRGDDLLVASPLNDQAGADAGAAYLYRSDGHGGFEETKILASDAGPGDLFGYFGTAMDGDALLIGGLASDGCGSDSGAAYLYRPDASGGFEETKFTASDGQRGDVYGAGVAMSGDDIVIASIRNDEAEYDAGAVYLYRPNSVGGHTETKIVANDPRSYGYFGAGLALSGGRLLVAAPGNDGAEPGTGAVYLYDLDFCLDCGA